MHTKAIPHKKSLRYGACAKSARLRFLPVLLCVLLLCGCMPAIAPPALPELVAWEPVEQQVLPPPPVDFLAEVNGWNTRFFEIQLDALDSARDFALEIQQGDRVGETRFYRLVDGAYVELGSLYGSITQEFSRSIPKIYLDEKGYLYIQEQSCVASYARVSRMYRVEQNRLVPVPPAQTLYDPFTPYTFTILRTFKAYQTRMSAEEFFACSPDAYDFADWDALFQGEWQESYFLQDSSITILGSDEKNTLIGVYRGNICLLPMKSTDQFLNGVLFPEYLYHEYVDPHYRAG